MTTDNIGAPKKQKITEAVDDGGDSSLPTTSLVVAIPPALLSFGNILKEFPDFLFCVLTYIADRVIWNSIAFSNKNMHAKSKSILPPWPIYYKLPPGYYYYTWSPCGTRMAYVTANTINDSLSIIDQRLGPLHNYRNAHGGHSIDNLKYSPNGRFLVSSGGDGFVRLWDNTGNYQQLQEWNMRQEVGPGSVCVVSSCSKYVAVSLGAYIVLKDVDGGKTIKSLMAPFISPNERVDDIRFSSNDRAIFICCRERNNNAVIKVWDPYLDDDDEDCLILLWRHTNLSREFHTVTFSNDNTMVAIDNNSQNKGTLWSLDTDHKCLTKKSDIPTAGGQKLHFTPDDKYLVCNNENGPTLWCTAEGTFTNNTLHLLKNRNNTKDNLVVEKFSPNNRQCIVRDPFTGYRYITTYSLK